MDKDRSLCGISTPPTSNSLELVAQSHVPSPKMLNHAYIQEQNCFNYPHPNTSNQFVSYDAQRKSYANATMSYDNNDALYYTNSSNEEDDEDLNSLNHVPETSHQCHTMGMCHSYEVLAYQPLASQLHLLPNIPCHHLNKQLP